MNEYSLAKVQLIYFIMLKTSFILIMALSCATSLFADPTLVPVTPAEDLNHDYPRSPIALPEFYIDGYTLTAASNTLGSTVELIDGSGSVVFSTYVYIEGDIELPATLSGTYTIRVTRGGQTFIGEITLL